MTENALFRELMEAILTNDEVRFKNAVESAARNNYSQHQLYLILHKVERWCRYTGLSPMLQEEATALVKIQSLFRMWYERCRLREKYNLYCKLCTEDSENYAAIAHKYHTILNM